MVIKNTLLEKYLEIGRVKLIFGTSENMSGNLKKLKKFTRI
jgi:hypothetical protein